MCSWQWQKTVAQPRLKESQLRWLKIDSRLFSFGRPNLNDVRWINEIIWYSEMDFSNIRKEFYIWLCFSSNENQSNTLKFPNNFSLERKTAIAHFHVRNKRKITQKFQVRMIWRENIMLRMIFEETFSEMIIYKLPVFIFDFELFSDYWNSSKIFELILMNLMNRIISCVYEQSFKLKYISPTV